MFVPAFSALKKNLSAVWPPFNVVVIPVIIPEKPWTLLIDVILSVWNGGNSIITSGGFDWL